MLNDRDHESVNVHDYGPYHHDGCDRDYDYGYGHDHENDGYVHVGDLVLLEYRNALMDQALVVH